MNKLIIGIDSHDSPFGGCTTHFTVFLIDHFFKHKKQLKLLTPPSLVRLNPFVPWKTRGNAAVSLTFGYEDNLDVEDLAETIIYLSNKYSGFAGGERKDNGIILIENPSEDDEVFYKKLYRKAVTDVLDPNLVIEKIRKTSSKKKLYGKRGIVGAAAAIGFNFVREIVSYELLVYRDHANYAKQRRVVWESIKKLEKEYYDDIFNNYDFKRNVPVAIPRGPDPVLFGLRGKNPCLLLEIYKNVRVEEKISYSMLFVTNQHSDAHSVYRTIGNLRAYQAGYITGLVSESPQILRGGHVKIVLSDATGSIDVYFYSPTKPMSIYASQLRKGDLIRVLGGTIPSTNGKLIFEAHKFWLLEATPIVKILNPRCPRCGKRMKSSGRNKGYKCPRCGYKVSGNLEKEIVIEKRNISVGPYTPPPGRINHLVKPPGIVLSYNKNVDCKWIDKLII